MRSFLSTSPIVLIFNLLATTGCGGGGSGETVESPREPAVATDTRMSSPGQSTGEALDRRVREFLKEKGAGWRDMNVPVSDGQFMYDLIIERGYKRALEIGTSTGHSAIWIAWALSKTGGKLITIEIDEDRHRQALENFDKAGLAPYIDARLADAHQLVKELAGPFDFVFSDADKGWYKQYFIDVAPNMAVGGCYISHNIWMRHHRDHDESHHHEGYHDESYHDESYHDESESDMDGYIEYLKSRTDFETAIERDKTSGVGVSCRKGEPSGA